MPYDIRLPDGTLVKDVPEDIPREEVRRRILKKHPEFATEQDRAAGLVSDVPDISTEPGVPQAVDTEQPEQDVGVFQTFKNLLDEPLGQAASKAFPAARLLFGLDEEAETTGALTGQGMLSLSKSLTDFFGAGNEYSKAIEKHSDLLGEYISAVSEKRLADADKIMQDAAGQGILEEFKAGVKAFATAPAEITAQVFGTAIPTITAIALAGTAGPLTALGTASGLGFTSGTGIVKGAIYDAVESELIKRGETPESAAEKASKAQEYFGENSLQIFAGGGLGVLATLTGLEAPIIGSIVKNSVAKGVTGKVIGGGLKEGIPEFLQGAQEQLAKNLALQKEGFDVDTLRGVVGAGTLEGLAGSTLGAVGEVALTDSAKDEETKLKDEVIFIDSRSVSDIKESQKAAKKQRIDEIAQEQNINKKEAAKVYKQELEEAQKKDVEEQPELKKSEPDEIVSGRVEPSVSTDTGREAGIRDTTQLKTPDGSGMGPTRLNVVGNRDAEGRIDDPVKLQAEINKTRNQIRRDESALTDPVAMREKVEFEGSTEEAVTAKLEKDIQQNKLKLSNLEAQKKPQPLIQGTKEFQEEIRRNQEFAFGKKEVKPEVAPTEVKPTEVGPEQQREGSVVKELIDAEPLKNIFPRVFGEEKTKVGVTPTDVKDFKKVFGRYLSASKEFQKLDEKLQNALIKKTMLDERLESVSRIKAPQTYELRKQASRASKALDSIYEKTYKKERPIDFNENPKEYQEAVSAISELGRVYRAAIGDDPTNIITTDNKAQIELTESFPELVKEEAAPTTEVKQEVTPTPTAPTAEVKQKAEKVTSAEVDVTPEQIKAVNNELEKQNEKAEADKPKFINATLKGKADKGVEVMKSKSARYMPDLPEGMLVDLDSIKQSGLLNIMTLRQIGESLPRVLVGASKKATQLPFIKQAIRVAAEQIPAYRNKIMRESQPVVELIQAIIADPNLGQSEAENLQIVMKEATIAQADPATREGRIIDPDLAKAYDALSPKAKQTYKAIRNYYKEQMKGVIEDIKQGARSVLDPKLDAVAIEKIDALVDEQFGKALNIRPYFPLRRFGNFWFQVGEDSDPDKEFYTFESESERNKYINMRKRELAEEGVEKDIRFGTEFIKDMAQKVNNPGFELLRQLEVKIDEIASQENIKDKKLFADELKDGLQQLSYLMMPEGNFRKMFINRKGIKGASSDLLRVFSTSAVNLAYQRTRVRYGKEYDQNMVDAQKAVGSLVSGKQKDFYERVVKELQTQRRRNQILGLEPTGAMQSVANMMTNLGFFMFLTAPASAALNIFGMVAIGIPIAVSRYGPKVIGSMSKYLAYYTLTPIRQVPGPRDQNGNPTVRSIVPDLGKSPELSNTQRMAYEKMVEDNVIDTSYTYDMAGITEKPVPLNESNTEKFMRYASAMFHHSERMNRSVLGLAIFDAAYAKKGGLKLEEEIANVSQELNAKKRSADFYKRTDSSIPTLEAKLNKLKKEQGQAFAFGVQEAKDLTFRALGDFTRTTKAPFFSTPVGKVLFQFKSYPLQMTYIMLRDFKVMTGITNDITPKILEQQLKEDGVSEEDITKAVEDYKLETKEFKKEAVANLGGVMLLTSLLGGIAAGIPLYTALTSLIEYMSQIDDEDEEYSPIYDAESHLYNWMTETMGLNNRVAAAIIRGVPGEYLNLGLSDRVSLDIVKLWFRDGIDKGDAEDYLTSLLINNLGPSVGIGINIAKATNFIREGEWYRAVEVMMPAIIKGPMMANRYAEVGAKTRAGEYYMKPEDMTPVDLFIRSIGFAPETVLRRQQTLIKKKGAMSKIEREKSLINQGFIKATIDADNAEFQKFLKKAIRFNKKYPGVKPIDFASFMNSFSSKTRNLLEREILDGFSKNFYLNLEDKFKVLGE